MVPVVTIVLVVVLVLVDVIAVVAVVAVAPCLLPLKFSTPYQYGHPGPLLQ